MATITGEMPAASLDIRPIRITIDLYERMAASGVFGDRSSVFLWKGQLVEKVSVMKGRPHVFAVNRLGRNLGRLLPEGYFVEQDQPIALGGESAPEPDLKVVRGLDADYLQKMPAARDVPLVIEVSDSSLAADLGEMREAYAREAIPIYWIVNLRHHRIEVYTEPTGPIETPAYRTRRDFGPDEDVPVVLDGVEVGRIAVRVVLPSEAAR
jgi:Uma2 family endonuclease